MAGAAAVPLLASGWRGKKIVEIGTRTRSANIGRALGEVIGQKVVARVLFMFLQESLVTLG